ncbi:hypothetical protein SERLA73DRAFT_26872, partial [Serpula lacrymans var. lacrymans S7.3]
ALSGNLSFLRVNMYIMFTVDLMHKIELGVWKTLCSHLLRMLGTCNTRLLYELDYRYREVPTFGSSTIRCFLNNCSEMREMVVHNSKDLLQ